MHMNIVNLMEIHVMVFEIFLVRIKMVDVPRNQPIDIAIYDINMANKKIVNVYDIISFSRSSICERCTC